MTKTDFGILEYIFKEELEELRLTEIYIQKQNLSELNNSLILINQLIDHPDTFSVTSNGVQENKYITKLFLEKKRMILNQIEKVSSLEKISSLQELVAQLPEDEIKSKLNNDLELLLIESDKYRKDAQQTEAKIKLEQHRIDGLERKSKIWLSFLQRESAASIIGGLVLLMLTLALIGGMIFGRESQILSNGFLVILGYFFGQSSVKNNKDGGSDSM